MKDIEIKISRKTSCVDLPPRQAFAVDGENLQGNIIFSFNDEFVNGQARLELTIDGQDSWIPLLKNEETYYCPIKSAITKKGQIDMQLVITENENEDGIPIFKSNTFYLWCESSINAEIEQPEEYPTWIEIANEKLNEMDNLDIEATKEDDTATITITKKDGTEQSVEIKDGETGPAGQDAKINGVNTLNIVAGDNIEIEQEDNTMTISSTGGGGGASEYVVRLTKENDEITSDKTISEIITAYNNGNIVKGVLADTEAGVDFNLSLLIAFEDSDFGLVQFATVYDSGDDFKSITIIGTLENNEDSWQYLDREMAYTAGTGIEITEGNVINNTLPNKIISITADEQTMQLDKTAGEINSLIEQGYLILLMGRLLFIEEYDSSHNKLYAYFYSGGFATKFTITGNQITSYESLDVVYDNHYTHTDNNYTNADKNKLDGLENKIITLEVDQSTMQFDKTADEVNEYLNNGYIVMALGYQVFRRDYNASTHTIKLAIFFGSFGQVITVVGNQLTEVSEYFYVSDEHYVHTDNNFSSYYKGMLDNAPEVIDLTSYSVGDTISDSSIVAKIKDGRTVIYYNGIYYRLGAIYGTGYVYTTMSGTDHGQWITLNYRSEYNDFYFYENDTAYWEVPSNKVQNLDTPTTQTYPSTLAVYNALQNVGGGMYLGDISEFTQNNPLDLNTLKKGLYLIKVPTTYSHDETFYLKATVNNNVITGSCTLNEASSYIANDMIVLAIDTEIKDMTFSGTTYNIMGAICVEWRGTSTSEPFINSQYKYIKVNVNGIITYNGVQNRKVLVTTHSDQTITGKKTFSTLPEIDNSLTPTTDYQLVNKKYVDDNAGGGGVGIVEISSYASYSNMPVADAQKIIDAILNTENKYSTYLLTPNESNAYVYEATLTQKLQSSTTSYSLLIKKILCNTGNNNPLSVGYDTHAINVTWSDGVPTVTSSMVMSAGHYTATFYPNGNTTSWTPSGNYSPASKKYVDDAIASIPSGGGNSIYLGYLNDFTDANRLDLTNLETGLYIIKVPNFSNWTSTELSCKADNNGTDILGDFNFYNGTGTILYSYLILNITNKIADMTITSSSTQFGRLSFVVIDNQGTLTYRNLSLKIKTTGMNYTSDTSTVYGKNITSYTGYDATKTQVLKNINGTLTWVDET